MSTYRKNKLLSVSPSVIEEGLAAKQDKLAADTAYDVPVDTDTLSAVDLTAKTVKGITFAKLWAWIKSKLFGEVVTITTATSEVKEAGVKKGTMNWTRVKTKVSDTQYHYHWFGYAKFDVTLSAYGTWGNGFLSNKWSIDLPTAGCIGKCVWKAALRSLTNMFAESYGTNQTLEWYFIRFTNISNGTATTLEVAVTVDYVGA